MGIYCHLGGLYATYHLLWEPETTIEGCSLPGPLVVDSLAPFKERMRRSRPCCNSHEAILRAVDPAPWSLGFSKDGCFFSQKRSKGPTFAKHSRVKLSKDRRGIVIMSNLLQYSSWKVIEIGMFVERSWSERWKKRSLLIQKSIFQRTHSPSFNKRNLIFTGFKSWNLLIIPFGSPHFHGHQPLNFGRASDILAGRSTQMITNEDFQLQHGLLN